MPSVWGEKPSTTVGKDCNLDIEEDQPLSGIGNRFALIGGNAGWKQEARIKGNERQRGCA